MITVIILTYNEQLHIARCIENARRVADKVYVVDSPSDDGTQEIARECGAEVVEHKYVNQAQQFQWALNNLPIETEWVMRLDADEVLSDELIQEIQDELPSLPKEVNGVYLPFDVVFQGRRLKYGKLKSPSIMRIFRRGQAYMEQRWMDERMVLRSGRSVTFKGKFIDHNLNSLAWWTQKHNNYSNRELAVEAKKMYDIGYDDTGLKERNQRKGLYYRIPPFFRAGLYFAIRYFFLLGFLDGKAGLVWHTLQAYWYRFLIDSKMEEMQRILGKDPTETEVRDYFRQTYNIEL